MSLLNISIKNVRKNLSFYALYLFSVAFILTIFFCFVSFSLNSVMLEKISEDGRVETMTRVISVFLMAFVVFYMSYSNSFFMKRRMKELGVYTLLGFRKSQVLKILTAENFIICLFSFIIGIIFGAAAHKGIVAGIVYLLDLNIDNSKIPLFNSKAILYSALFVLFVNLALSASNFNVLRKASLLGLVRLEKSGEKKLKVHIIPTILGLLMMAAGDILALDCIREKESLWFKVGVSPIGLLVVILIFIGTSLFIYSFLPYVCKRLEHRLNLLYKPTAIITIPKFIHRIRMNARTLTMLSLLSAATLCVFGVSALSAYYPIAATSRIIPSAIEFRVENPETEQKVITALNNKFGKNNFKLSQTKIIKVTASSTNLPFEYSISKNKGREPCFEVISEKDFKSLLAQQGKKDTLKAFGDADCILVKYRPDSKSKDIGSHYKLNLSSKENIDVTVRKTILQNPIGFSNSVGTLLVSNKTFTRLKNANLPNITVCSIDGKGFRDNKEAYETLKPILADNKYFASAFERTYEIKYSGSSTFLLLGFLTILFFIASGSILYFHNISAVTYNKSDYEILSKIGYSRNRIKTVIRKQISAIFLIPFLLGLIHAVCGMFCYKSLLMDDVLGKSSEMILPCAASILVSAFIYLIYFLITKKSCYRIALK